MEDHVVPSLGGWIKVFPGTKIWLEDRLMSKNDKARSIICWAVMGEWAWMARAERSSMALKTI